MPAPPSAVTEDVPRANQVDLRSLDHVTSIDDNLICSVCHCAFIKPVMISPCEHIFCTDCFEAASRQRTETCPFCRTPTNGGYRTAPRALANMADDLQVKCPHWEQGCDRLVSRGCVQSHIDKYCGYAEVDCPAERCASKILRKDLAKVCLHNIVACEDCYELVIQKDLIEHQENECLNRWLSCAKCDREFLHCQANVHESDCPELIVGCTGHVLGCKYSARRAELPDHLETCPFAALEPVVRAQSDRIQALEVENKLMRRRWDSFGVGDLPEQMAEASRLPPFDATASASTPTVPETDSAPFDSAIHHLLSSYESLRSDIDRLSTSLSEVDGRQSMLQMNESLRIKEDFSHVNAVIGSMRVQLHWLMSTRLQTQARTAPSTVTGAGPSNANGSGIANLGPQPGRRTSDTPRQDTKL